MEMYNEKVDSNHFNVSIDGLQLVGEEITPNESFNRRETSRKNIIGGTQSVIRTGYIQRDFTFKSHLRVDPDYPDVYDSTFKLWQSKPVEVISKEMGGKFNAECIVKKLHETPAYLTIEVQLIEIPDETSLIPNDVVKTPTDKITKTSTKDKNKDKKDKKSTKKTTKKGNTKGKGKGKGKGKKGNNITKVK